MHGRSLGKVGYPRSRRIILEDSIEASSFADDQLDPRYLFSDGVPDGHEGGASAAELAWTVLTSGRARRSGQRRDKGKYAIRASHEPLCDK
jgi:hypothetical protein